MANVVGYEQLAVTGNAVVRPTTATIRGALCAVFLVDPTARGAVRWRLPDAPSGSFGLPLHPGRWISVAGANNVRDSKFILDAGSDERTVWLHCLYFDRVDVVAADFAPPSPAGKEPDLSGVVSVLSDILAELKEHTELLDDL